VAAGLVLVLSACRTETPAPRDDTTARRSVRTLPVAVAPAPCVCDAPDAATAECVGREESRAYLAAFSEKTYAAWTLPDGIPANQCVKLRVSFSSDGALAGEPTVLLSTDDALRNSGLQALRVSTPFEPLPAGAGCLAGRELTMLFRNPAVEVPDRLYDEAALARLRRKITLPEGLERP
jgi:hypothetical protein